MAAADHLDARELFSKAMQLAPKNPECFFIHEDEDTGEKDMISYGFDGEQTPLSPRTDGQDELDQVDLAGAHDPAHLTEEMAGEILDEVELGEHDTAWKRPFSLGGVFTPVASCVRIPG